MQLSEKPKRGQSWEEKLSQFIPKKEYNTLKDKIADFLIGFLGTIFVLLVIIFTPIGDILNKLGFGPEGVGENAGGVWILAWWFISIVLAMSSWKLRKYVSLGIMLFWIITTFLLVAIVLYAGDAA